MTDDLGFFLTAMPASRPADYYLGCLDGCIFLDFSQEGNLIRLIRISFDGYGCYELKDQAVPMNKNDSRVFKEQIAAQLSDQKLFETIMKKTISDNKKLIGEDALNEYDLI